ncbi:GTPase Obg [uncultured archaeon]|nr:GTPase Obg [uncultured archaeon]
MFETLPYVHSAEDLIGIAFRSGAKKARLKRSESKHKPREKRMRGADEERIKASAVLIQTRLEEVVDKFPSFEQLPPFEQELLSLKVGKDAYKKHLGAIHWAANAIERVKQESLRDVRNGDDTASVHFQGRCASIVNRVSKDLDKLIVIKMALLDFPSVKDQPTVVVAGYPNAGKSTFVRALTGAKVKIAAYPFTTQQILIGRRKIRHATYQVVDSPGLLDRPLSRRNPVEREAVLALKHLAHRILFLVDPTQSLAPQISLLEEIRTLFSVPVTVAINDKSAGGIDEAKKGFPGAEVFCAQDEEASYELLKKIFQNQ